MTPATFDKRKSGGGQAMAEYVIAMFLCALVAVGAFKMYQTAARVHYNGVARARTGITGMRP